MIVDMLLWALLGTIASLGVSIVSALFAGRKRRKIAALILDEVVTKNFTIPDIKLINDLQTELQNIIKAKGLPVELVVAPFDKKISKVTIRPSGEYIPAQFTNQTEQESYIEILKSALRHNLSMTSIAVITSIAALFMVGFSFMILLKPSSKLDLLTVAIAPLVLVIAVFTGWYLGRILRKFRIRK